MAEKPKPGETTEQTPKGLTVPVPRREAFFDNLKKVAKPDKDSTPGGPRSSVLNIASESERWL